MRMALNRSNNGDLSATLSTLRHSGWGSATTLATALYELMAVGLLVRTRAGGVEHGSRVCSLYGFTDLDIFEHPTKGIPASKATHGYRQFTSVREAEQALKAGVAKLRAEAVQRKAAAAARKNSTLHKLDRNAPQTGAIRRGDAPRSGADASSSIQQMEQRK
jgi:hypothetical protein